MRIWFKHESLRKVPAAGQWCILVAVSAVLAALLGWMHLPAALLLGPMFAGILLETSGGTVRVPAGLYWFSQATIGCMIARVITRQIWQTFAGHWPLFVTVMLAVIIASCALGWLLSRLRLFPGTTAIWGLLPGAASVMMLMADAFGADSRLVAFMQYLRVVFVAIAASVIARLCFHAGGGATAVNWFPHMHWPAFLETLAFIGLSIIVGRWSKIPAGIILIPLVIGTGLNLAGVITFELPRWFLAISFALLGWNTGLRFNREILAHATRTFPQTVLSVVLLIGFCGGLAWLLAEFAGVDPLTAYLATSPGGVDSVAVIAASSKVDMPFVMSMQAMRLLVVLMIGPGLSRWVAGLVAKPEAQ